MVLRNVGVEGRSLRETYDEIVIAIAIQFYEILLAKQRRNSIWVESHKNSNAVNFSAATWKPIWEKRDEKKTNFANYLPIKHNQSSPAFFSLSILTDIFNYQNLLQRFLPLPSLTVIFISRQWKNAEFYLLIAYTNDIVCSLLFGGNFLL